jgi:hypothetical protein
MFDGYGAAGRKKATARGVQAGSIYWATGSLYILKACRLIEYPLNCSSLRKLLLPQGKKWMTSATSRQYCVQKGRYSWSWPELKSIERQS